MFEIILCRTCGNAFPINDDLPELCPICADDRQYLLPDGQVWLHNAEIVGEHEFALTEPEPGAEGRGVLFSGDTIAVTASRTASFMRSYPNDIPLSQRLVRQIVDAVEPYDFDRIYGAFGTAIDHDAKRIVRESADRYIGWLTDTIRDPDERTLLISPVP